VSIRGSLRKLYIGVIRVIRESVVPSSPFNDLTIQRFNISEAIRVHSWFAPEIVHRCNPCHPWFSALLFIGVYSCPFVVEPENLKKFSLNAVEGISTTRVNVYN
jgi:hypothetical protein